MSRSNPQDQVLPNPSTRWLSFNGSTGRVKHFDKDAKEPVLVDYPFTFILLDILASVRGWDEDLDTDIYSNEVRNIATDILVVSRRKGAKVATGVYSAIKETVNKAGAEFHNNLYIAYKDGKQLKIGSLRFKGAAVSAWMAFEKANKAQLYEQAIVITGTDEHKNSGITYRTPKFTLNPISAETQAAANALDVDLQAYLKSVIGKANATPHLRDEDMPTTPAPTPPSPPDHDIQFDDITDDVIPF